MVTLNIVLMALVSVAIVSLLTWSICTQHRHAGCEHVRVGRRRQRKPRVVSLDKPEFLPDPGPGSTGRWGV